VSIAYENIHNVNFVDVSAFAADRFEFFTLEVELIARMVRPLVFLDDSFFFHIPSLSVILFLCFFVLLCL